MFCEKILECWITDVFMFIVTIARTETINARRDALPILQKILTKTERVS